MYLNFPAHSTTSSLELFSKKVSPKCSIFQSGISYLFSSYLLEKIAGQNSAAYSKTSLYHRHFKEKKQPTPLPQKIIQYCSWVGWDRDMEWKIKIIS